MKKSRKPLLAVIAAAAVAAWSYLLVPATTVVGTGAAVVTLSGCDGCSSEWIAHGIFKCTCEHHGTGQTSPWILRYNVMGKSECDLEPDFRHKCAIQLVEGEDAVDKAYCRLEKNMSGVGVCSCADPNMPCCDPPVGDPPPDPGLEPEPGESSDPGFDQKPGDPPPAPSPSGGEAGGIPG